MIKYYMVGGWVRDSLLGIKNKDIDFAVEAPSYEAMKNDLLNQGTIIFQEKSEFFSIRAKHPIWGPADFTLCRKDGYYSDNRHPDTVEIGTIYDDLGRRDFTVNAIAYRDDPTSSMIAYNFIDPYNGIADLKNRVLRCVGNPEDRFNEDPLRLLRAVRFAVTKSFYLHLSIIKCLDDEILIDKLSSVSIERIYEELRRAFEHNSFLTLLLLNEHEFLRDKVFSLGIDLQPRIRHENN